MTDIATITFRVTSLRRLHDDGRIVALAEVTVDLDGIPLVLHGLQIVRVLHGLECRMPHYRTPTGAWAPAVTLPEELGGAIGREVLDALE